MHGNVAGGNDQKGAQGFPHQVLVDAVGQLVQMLVSLDQAVQGGTGGFQVFNDPAHGSSCLADGPAVILCENAAHVFIVLFKLGVHFKQKARPVPAWERLSRF